MAAEGESKDDIEALSNSVDNQLNISDGNEQHGSETPEQKWVSQGARPKTAQRQLQYSSPQSTNKNDEGMLFHENKDGKWLKTHPWDNMKPKNIRQIKMTGTVDMSSVYTASDEWQTGSTSDPKVDLEKIYLKLPEFIKKMKGPSIRHELEVILKSLSLMKTRKDSTPHVLEIITEMINRKPTDKPSICDGDENGRCKAYSLKQQQNHRPSKKNYWYLDCEYMLTMYLSDSSWFDDHEGKRITAINPRKKDKRWIFIPSFRRAEIALLKWPEDDIVTPESTIRILVARPSEFDEYVKCYGHMFPVISLPQDEIGAGYPRFWIQKIALRLKLDFIWMIDDSVECFYEYHPKQNPPKPGSFTVYRRRQFGLVFQRIEKLVKDTKDETQPIAAMSPKRFMGGRPLKDPFVCKPPQIAVFLNLAALKSKDVYYRPELQTKEDMIFGYECEQNGLKVFMDNRIHLYDHKWKDTGARSPSVRQNLT